MDPDSIEAKQEFLRTEIIDKGYDPAEFEEFMMEQRNEEEIDLRDWNLSELQSVVIKFQVESTDGTLHKSENQVPPVRGRKSIWDKRAYQESTEEKEKEKEDSDPLKTKATLLDEGAKNYNYYRSKKSVTSQDTSKKDSDNTEKESRNKEEDKKDKKNSEQDKKEGDENEDEEEEEEPDPNCPFSKYSEIIVCSKQSPNMYTDMNNLFFTVSDPEYKKTGMFSAGYYQYTIKNNVNGTEVVRKLKDFDWIREKLVELYPGVFVPPLAPSHYTLKDDSPKKLAYLARFVNSLAQIKFIRSTEIFHGFVTLPQIDFDARKKEFYDKMTRPKSLSQFTTQEGIINIKISTKSDKKAVEMQKEIYKKIDGFKKLDSALDAVIYHFEELNKKFNDLSKAFKGLQNIYENDGVLDKCFDKFSEFMGSWSEGYKNQKIFFTEELKYYFKYMEKEYNSIIPICNTFKQSRDSYEIQFKRVKKMQAPNQKEDKNLEQLRKYYGYYLIKLLQEANDLNVRHQERIANQLIIMNEKRNTFMEDYEHFIKLIHANV